MKKSFTVILPAVGAALIAVLAQITIPIGPVPFALQNMAVGLVATIFHRKEALLAVTLYLLLGAIGLPVFAISKNSSFLTIFLANILGDALVFIGGVLGLMLLARFSLDKAITVGIIPFILPDLIKLIVICLVTIPIFKNLKNHPYFKN